MTEELKAEAEGSIYEGMAGAVSVAADDPDGSYFGRRTIAHCPAFADAELIASALNTRPLTGVTEAMLDRAAEAYAAVDGDLPSKDALRAAILAMTNAAQDDPCPCTMIVEGHCVECGAEYAAQQENEDG